MNTDKMYMREFSKTFKKIGAGKSDIAKWDDFIQLMANAMGALADPGARTLRNDTFNNIAQTYTSDQMRVFSELSAIVTFAFEENPEQDFLGKLYTELGLLKKAHGQFFTPYTVGLATARASFEQVPETINKHGRMYVCDPACGSGCLLIAFANHARKSHTNYQRDIVFVGADIDERVAQMCYIQLTLLGCMGTVRIEDSLAQTPIDKRNLWELPRLSEYYWQQEQARRQINQVLDLLWGEETNVMPENTVILKKKR